MSSFNMSRFANPNRTEVLSLGPCQCPGTPHEQDEAIYRVELGAGEEERAGTYGWASTGYEYFDSAAARCKLIEIGVVRWNLLGPEGEPMPINAKTAALLDQETQDLITHKLDEVTARAAPRPKKKRARSGNGLPTSASHTRTTPAQV